MEPKPTQQPSQQSDPFYDFLAWLQVNKKQVLIGLIAIAVIGSAIGIYIWHKNSSETNANEALLAIPSGQLVRTTQPPSPDAFLKIADEYPATSAGERAELLAAGAFFTDGKYDKAKAAFEKFINDHPDSGLRPQADFGVAACLEAQGSIDAALVKYQQVEQQYPGQNVVPLAQLARGRLLEAQNKAEDALKVYSSIESSPLAGMWRTEAIDHKEKLLAKHPELAKKFTPESNEQILEVTTPPEGSTNAPKVRVLTNAPSTSTVPTTTTNATGKK